MINERPAQIASVYVNYLKAFMKRADVQNGKLVSYHDNQDPMDNLKDENWVNLGDARVTTGFCVSFCQGIMHDELFKILLQSRGALAKLVSIDIKEQYYGYCKPSYIQNMWHTAILIRDNGINLILDPTCAQFGNQFVGKLVWDLETWINTFRSPNDIHDIRGFNDNIIEFAPKSVGTANYNQAMMLVKTALHNITTITDAEREVIADFFLEGCDLLNRKIIMGNLTDNDFKYMDTINNYLKQFPFKQSKEEYLVMKFNDINAVKNWIASFTKNDFILPIYMPLSSTINDSCNWFGFDPENINIETNKDERYVVIKFNSIIGCDVSKILKHLDMFLPYGIKVNCDIRKDIYNGGKLLTDTAYGIEKKTNTTFIEVSY